jgi:hypothetical protein
VPLPDRIARQRDGKHVGERRQQALFDGVALLRALVFDGGLRGLTAPHGIRRLEFLTTLDEVRLTCDLDAGSEVPPEPVAQRRAPLLAGGRMPVSGDNGIGLLADELPSLVERRTAPKR